MEENLLTHQQKQQQDAEPRKTLKKSEKKVIHFTPEQIKQLRKQLQNVEGLDIEKLNDEEIEALAFAYAQQNEENEEFIDEDSE